MALAAGWVLFWVALIPPNDPIQGDAIDYIAMAEGRSPVRAPFGFRVAVPLIASVLPLPAAEALRLITYVSLAALGVLWIFAMRHFRFSGGTILITALALSTTQGWVGLFANPYLVDATALLFSMAAWWSWSFSLPTLAGLLIVTGAFARETVAPLIFLLLDKRHWVRSSLLLILVSTPLVGLRLWVSTTHPLGFLDAFASVWRGKGPVRVITDAIASFHALWLLMYWGARQSRHTPRQTYVPVLGLMLAMGAGLSLMAVNTVRMFSFALPFAGFAIAECLERVWLHSRGRACALETSKLC